MLLYVKIREHFNKLGNIIKGKDFCYNWRLYILDYILIDLC